MNGAFWSLNKIITQIFNTLKQSITPLASNVIYLEAIVCGIKPPCETMASTMILFKSFEVAPSTTHCKDNNKIIICQFSTTYVCVWIESQDYWSMVVISSYEKEINLAT
jgi:hypothetical protein